MEHLNALPAGTRIAEYELVEVLGAGGFGLTYRAWDIALEKYIAIKEYLPRDFATRTNTLTVVPTSSADRADYEWGLTRFLDEARTLARFNHPHVNKVQRYFEAHGTAYLVLEYVEGETLSRVLERQGRLSEAAVLRLLSEVLSGLEEVHEAGYVHRDIKPGNLMVQPDGSIVILDFGAARQAVGQRSKSITSILTPGYAPIEQYDTKAEDVGPWSDIYALGMVAYRCISGLPDGELPDAVTRSRATRKGSGDLEPAASIGQGQYDARLLRAIDWAIQVEEDARPQSIAEWQQALPGQTPSESRATPPAGPTQTTTTSDTSSSLRWAIVAGVVALVVAVGGGAYWLGQRPSSLGGEPAEVTTGPAVTEPVQTDRPALTREPAEPAPEPQQTASTEPERAEPPVPAEADELSPVEVEAGLELDRDERRLVQHGLVEAGQEPGPADGLFGGESARTRRAIRAWQAAKYMEASGYLTREQADTLMALGQEAEAQQAAARRAAQAQAERLAQEADEAAYTEAQQVDTAEAYGAYLAAYPAGRHVDAARASQRRLRDQAGRQQRAERERVIAQLNAQMVHVPGGSFTMGCQEGFFSNNDCEADEQPAHQVQVSSFELSKYEVTQELWAAVMGANPSHFSDCTRCPVEQVSWADIQGFLRELNAGGGRYRLPSEAEWEYAAWGGVQSRGYQYAGSDSPRAVAWYYENSGRKPHPVGQKQANELGLYDMSGNVREWVQDCWNDSYAGAPSNGQAWERGDCGRRVLRGGSWGGGSWYLRPALRFRLTAVTRDDDLGLRLARSLP